MRLTQILAVAATAAVGDAHIRIIDPVPITSPDNHNSDQSSIDYNINSPVPSLGQFPCKNALRFWDQPAGASVRSYVAGQTYSMVMASGGADHEGGSCQISLSYDIGRTFTVISSIIGSCAKVGASYAFTVPADAPAGRAVFSWSWNNRIGNREFYQDCSAVYILPGGDVPGVPVIVPFTRRPGMFVGNLPGSGWCVAEGVDVVYPSPGPDVVYLTDRPGRAYLC